MSALGDSNDLRARREAAAWLVKQDRGLEPAEQDEFFQWLAADPRNGEWFARHRQGWQRLDGITAWRPAEVGEPNPDVLALPEPARWRRPVWLAAAAAIAIAAGTWWLVAPRDDALVPAAAPVVSNEPIRYEKRTLADGSVAELARGAELEVRYSTAERRVVLRGGEGTFSVEKDPVRPFIVQAADIEVRAIGTVFNVQHATGRVNVLVSEGKVQVAPPRLPPAKAPMLVAGDRAVVPLAGNAPLEVGRASEDDWSRLRAWQPQLLDFSSVPLADVIAELNRRNRVQLVLADPGKAAVPIVASIRSDNLEGFVNLVAAATGMTAERRGEYEIVLRAKR